MDFNLEKTIEILQNTPNTLASMLENLSPEWTSNNEGGETWNVFDVVGHLVYLEKTDWMSRIEIILSDNSDKTFKPVDRFAQFEESKGKSLTQLLDEFKVLRQKNIEKLISFNLNEEDLNKTGIHPAFGEVKLEQLISTWTVHDLDHISQISRVMAKQYKDAVGSWFEYLKILKQI